MSAGHDPADHALCTVPDCGRPSPDGLAVCGACWGRLEVVLGDMTALDADLEAARYGQQTFSRGGRGDDYVPRWSDRARAAQHDLRNALTTWVRAVHGERPDEAGPRCVTCWHPSCLRVTASRMPADTATGCSLWLLSHGPAVRRHEAGGELVDELLDSYARGMRAIDRPAERWYAGPCDGLDGQHCGADLYARVGARIVACRSCEAEYDVAERREWLLDIAEDELLTAAEMSRALPVLAGREVTSSMIRGYAARGRLLRRSVAPEGADVTDGRALYRVGDVIDLLHDTPIRASA